MKPQTRTETVTRQGRAHTVVRRADPPAVPRDWDLMLLRGELALAGLLSLVTVVWSTYSIGDLLGGSWAAYGGAITFDVAWLAVQGMEWLARYQPDRRGRARRVGLALLAVSVGAITYHGHLHGALAQGAFGAGIALGAKLLWSTVLSHLVCELDPDTQAWVDAEHREAHAMLATATVHRTSERARGQAAAHRRAVEVQYGVSLDEHQVQRVDEHQVLDVEPEPEPWTVREDAVNRAVVDQIRARAIASTYGTAGREWRSAMDQANRSMMAAVDAGASTATVLEQVERHRSARRISGDSPRMGGYPQATDAETPPPVRPVSGNPPAEDAGPEDDEERVPAQRPPSARTLTHGLARAGMSPEAVRQTLGAMGMQVSPATVDRYVREARQQPQAAPAAEPEQGWYP
ncbi:hypothetical protein [Streptomyces sp. NPDC056165]|uniref:hypothetical protein n=1 Tax=Streptomyces sp. NPDC056165 TaxID=3345733 RepID=UPI0035E0D2E4